MTGPRVTVIGRDGCHLCEEAEQVVDDVCRGVGLGGKGEGWESVSIEDDSALYDRYWDQIPVILVDGRRHTCYRVDPHRLAAALG